MTLTIYEGVVNSPEATLVYPISALDVSMNITPEAALPAGPNIAVIGTGEDAETVLYTSNVGGLISGMTRAYDTTGTYGAAKNWGAGEIVARRICKYDMDAMADNITTGTGDVIGPSTCTSGNIVVFTGTDGKHVADSGLKIPTLESGKYLTNNGSALSWDTPAGGSASRWTAIAAFTRTPPSTSTITLTGDQSATVKTGMPIRFAHTTVYYAIITGVSVSTDTTVTIAGAPLTASSNWIDASSLYIGTPEMIVQEAFAVPGYFDDNSGNTTLLKSDLLMEYRWKRGKAYLVMYGIVVDVLDTGASQPTLTPIVNGSDVASTPIAPASADTWVYSVVAIDPATYDINPGESLEIKAVTGTNHDSRNLTMEMFFVLE